MVIDKQLHGNIVEVMRRDNKILLLKLILDRGIFNIISIYASQVALDESSKYQFQDDLDELI